MDSPLSRLALIGFVLWTIVARPAGQSAGPGTITFPNSGAAEAQDAFLRGLAALHGFDYEEAIDAFLLAQRQDRGFAMAYWGEAMAYNQPIWHGQDLAAARRALTRLAPTPGERAARASTERERAYLAAAEVLFGEGDKPARDAAYADAMRLVSERYPEDVEAALFHALALLGTQPPDERVAAVADKAAAILQPIFARAPDHPAAAHYLIHAYDDPAHARLALPAARHYAKIAPASSQALHTPAQIFVQLGMWDEAARADEAAYAASEARVRQRGLPGALRDYRSLAWLQFEYLQQGRIKKALEMFGPIEEAVQDTDATVLKELLASMRARFVIETETWDNLKAQSTFFTPDELFAVALSAARTGSAAPAEQGSEMLKKVGAAEPRGAPQDLLQVMALQLEALALLLTTRPTQAIAQLEEAAALESRIAGRTGLPQPIKPTQELLGETLLELGRARDAAAAFENALERAPNRPRSILGLARAAAIMGDVPAARRHYDRLLKIWHQADPALPELQEARAFVERS